MGRAFRIRPARSADTAALGAIERATFSDAWPVAAFATPGPGAWILVAERAGAPLGFIVVRAAADEAEILDLAVVAAERRRGVGGALVGGALDRLAGQGARRVFLEVRASNEPALACYRRYGFEVVGRRPGYYRKPPEDALLMARDVTPVTPDA